VKRSDRILLKAPIPRALYQAILKIQANEGIDFNKAALKATSLIDLNSERFKEAVQSEASHLARSQFMKQINATRQTIRAQAFKECAENVRRFEDNFRVPCSICGKPMHFSSRNSNWEKVKPLLDDAFSDWHHIKCGEQRK
jgi:hypothetical protein